ncbi:hypothetical protein [Maribacter ulvicola]|uniref:SGNH/GDSL hydrolase family protein n=1 Tax=Maribacter ulvicola TaxID=228959 RepID=A0A1N6VHX0_9FLAO|nr:hypothetical protein [Maribacter ulvicola]SIQ77483.1 hypothetical protein SAMN05421797_103139 [Maribacter ulvicola]
MKLFLKNIFLFCLVSLLFGEIVCRFSYVTSDIPSRIIDKNNIQKYNPNQTGKWIGNSHSWHINKDGWPGSLPKSRKNLITIIGDSYVENFMNPDSCRQSVFLKKMLPTYNFYEASRSGVSFIEAMSIASVLDSLQPLQQLIYIHDADLLESVVQIKKMPDITQYDSENIKIIPGILKSPGLKKILYNWKLIYYLYTNYSFGIKHKNDAKPKKENIKNKSLTLKDREELKKLLSYVNRTFNKSNISLVYRPNGNPEILKLLTNFDFKIILLVDHKEKEWSFEHDPHWTCTGHEEAAEQVSLKLSRK